MGIKAALVALTILSSIFAGCIGNTDASDDADKTDEIVGEDIFGCTNPDALNYDENSTKDDGTCNLESVEENDDVEADNCTTSTANNTNAVATQNNPSDDFSYTEILKTMGEWGNYQAQVGFDNNNLVIGDTIYFIINDLWSFNFDDGFKIHPIDGIQFTYPNELVELDGVIYFSAEEVIDGERTYDYATFAHDLSNSTTWRISDNSHLSNFEWGFHFEGNDFFLSENTVQILNDDGTSSEVYSHDKGVWCQSCGEVGVTEHGIVFVASDGDVTGNHLELWLLNLDNFDNEDDENTYSREAIQLTNLNLSDNYNTMIIDILSITDESVVFATNVGWSLYSLLHQYSFDNQTVWQVHSEQVNLELHQELQGYTALGSSMLFIPEWDYSTGESSVMIYNSCVGVVHKHDLGQTSTYPNAHITDEELIVAYRPVNVSIDSSITYVVGMNQMTGEIRNITSFDQSDLLNSTTEAPAGQGGIDGGVVVFDKYIFLRARGQLLVHDTVEGHNWVNTLASQTIQVKYFQCDNGELILFYLANNAGAGGIEDCSDGSDEVDWEESENPDFPGNFTCDDGTEIEFWDLNNYWNQCPNGEDEWYPDGFIAMNDGWDLFVLGDNIIFRSGWNIYSLDL